MFYFGQGGYDMNNMMIGKGIVSISRTSYTKGNRHITKLTFKRADGSDAGSISITKSVAQKKKRLQYNFKQISNMLLMTKTSNSAGRVVTKARANVAMLQRKLKIGEYDDQELQSAIVHAKKLERIAKKRMRHLKEEEKAQREGECTDELERKPDEVREEEDAKQADADTKQSESEREQELTQEELKQLMRQMNRLMEETIQQLDEITELDELADELVGAVPRHMDKEDLERLKKKHRLDEMREIVEADMKYLKALFGRLEREKQAAASGSSSGNYGNSGSTYDSGGVSLQLSDMPVPVQTAEAPVLTEGGTIDVSV